MADDVPVVRTESRPAKYIICTGSQYKSLVDSETVNPYNLYLVNDGVEVETGYTYTEFYYGYNRLTDIIIKKGPINESEILNIPNNKLVLCVDEDEDTSQNGNGTRKIKFLGVKLKYNDQVIGIADFSFRSLEQIGNTLKMEVAGSSVDQSVNQPIYIPLLSELPPSGDGSHYLNDRGEYTIPAGGSNYEGEGFIQVNNTTHKISTNLQGDGTSVVIDPNTGVISAIGGGGGGVVYTPGDGIAISTGTTPAISVKLKASDSGLAFDTDKGLYVTSPGTVYTGTNGVTVTGTVISADMTYINQNASFTIDDGVAGS